VSARRGGGCWRRSFARSGHMERLPARSERPVASRLYKYRTRAGRVKDARGQEMIGPLRIDWKDEMMCAHTTADRNTGHLQWRGLLGEAS
jgi:hypothetical protein